MMKDLNYFPLNVESNIYGMTTLQFEDRSCKVLVATSDCRIFCINYNKFKPHTKGVEFTYIPNGAKIISIGALKRGPNDFVIGITHSLAPNTHKSSTRSSSSFPVRDLNEHIRQMTYYFNIYASGSMTPVFDLDNVAQGCQTIRLRYAPYHLYQTQLVSVVDRTTMSLEKKPVWLLSGGDNSIHAFSEECPYHSFNEIAMDDCFPELSKIPGLALWIDVLNIGATHANCERAIALGFEDGSVRLYHSVLSKQTCKFTLIRESQFDDFTTIIPAVRLFNVKSIAESKLRSKLRDNHMLKDSLEDVVSEINLLVVSSTNPSLVFRDILRKGFEDSHELPGSCRLDCATAAAIGDINADGFNELIIGTHGRELLTYQYDMQIGTYGLERVSVLNYPIYAVSVLDLTGDSLNDLTILVSSGILIQQSSVEDKIELCRRRASALLPILNSKSS